jgi:hypothetical protein
MRKKWGPEFECLWFTPLITFSFFLHGITLFFFIYISLFLKLTVHTTYPEKLQRNEQIKRFILTYTTF